MVYIHNTEHIIYSFFKKVLNNITPPPFKPNLQSINKVIAFKETLNFPNIIEDFVNCLQLIILFLRVSILSKNFFNPVIVLIDAIVCLKRLSFKGFLISHANNFQYFTQCIWYYFKKSSIISILIVQEHFNYWNLIFLIQSL